MQLSPCHTQKFWHYRGPEPRWISKSISSADGSEEMDSKPKEPSIKDYCSPTQPCSYRCKGNNMSQCRTLETEPHCENVRPRTSGSIRSSAGNVLSPALLVTDNCNGAQPSRRRVSGVLTSAKSNFPYPGIELIQIRSVPGLRAPVEKRRAWSGNIPRCSSNHSVYPYFRPSHARARDILLSDGSVTRIRSTSQK